MITLIALCLMLYGLGCVLAYTLCQLHIEGETPARGRSSFRQKGAIVSAVLFWPVVAICMLRPTT